MDPSTDCGTLGQWLVGPPCLFLVPYEPPCLLVAAVDQDCYRRTDPSGGSNVQKRWKRKQRWLPEQSENFPGFSGCRAVSLCHLGPTGTTSNQKTGKLLIKKQNAAINRLYMFSITNTLKESFTKNKRDAGIILICLQYWRQFLSTLLSFMVRKVVRVSDSPPLGNVVQG